MSTASRLETPSIAVLPPGEAYDYDYFRARLGDEELLSRSVAIRVFRMPFLAVPAGGTRRGGCFPTDSMALALAVRDALKSYNGFPALRVGWLCSPVASWGVAWGDRPPVTWDDESQRLNFYGLHAPAAPGRSLTPSPAVLSCSPTAS
ncbi:DUF6302 family protein [Streptomyces sp. 5K101]|uniref:DUF6302 family protein n=1 Tax=Streptomyces sp. 5K101 TaxID=3390037 RepID=UPI0039763EB0